MSTDHTDQGGRAFPWCGDLNDMPTIELGMTLRDYHAAKAMQGMLSGGTWPDETDQKEIARRAYLMADYMSKARAAQ